MLDACVLAPLTMREVLFAAARAGMFVPLWSSRIEEEWRRAAAKEARGLSQAAIDGDLALARAAFPQARVVGWEGLEPTLLLPDPDDRHVLAAAIVGRAARIVTDNIGDFPKRALEQHGIERTPTDLYLRGLADARPDVMRAALADLFQRAPFGLSGAADALKAGRLPRLAKFLRA